MINQTNNLANGAFGKILKIKGIIFQDQQNKGVMARWSLFLGTGEDTNLRLADSVSTYP